MMKFIVVLVLAVFYPNTCEGAVSWKKANYEVGESEGVINVCLERTDTSNVIQTIQITTAGVNARNLDDFTAINQITFTNTTGNPALACINVQILGNVDVEPSETFTLTIDDAPGIASQPLKVTTVTIVDDDVRAGWVKSAYIFSEAFKDTAIVYIEKSGNMEITLSIFSATYRGSATGIQDFKPVQENVAIPAGEKYFPVTIELIDDTVDEMNETFNLTLILVEPKWGTISNVVTVITILDNDDPTPTETTSENNDGLGGGAIAAIVVSIIIGASFAVVAIAVFFYMKFIKAAGSTAATAAGTRTAFEEQQLRAAGAGGFPNVPATYGFQNEFGNFNGFGANAFGNYGFGKY